MTAIIQKTIALADIAESPTNPRKHFDATELEDLAVSIQWKGVLQPVLVRPRETPACSTAYELVAGARRYRASKMAGLTEIPAVIRDLTDAEVLEAQVIENNQRKDVHPLEEADGFAALARAHGHTVETIAAKIGRSTSYVYQRIKLAELSPGARKYCFDGKLSLAGALVLARLPSVELQELALADILRRSHSVEPFELWMIKDVVRHNYTLQLADAPFDTQDATILPAAGACTKCPKRTGAQAEMFADFDGLDRCTDVKCFSAKKDANWAIRTAAARKRGLSVLDGDDAKALFAWGGHVRHESAFIDLDEEVVDDDDNEATWRARLGNPDLRVTLARDENGRVHELVLQVDALEHVKGAKGRDLFALSELTNMVDRVALHEDGDDGDEEKESLATTRHRERALEDAMVAATTRALVAAVEKQGIKGKAVWLAFLVACEDFANEERIATHRGLPTEGLLQAPGRKGIDRKGSFLQRLAFSMNEKQVAALVVEILSDTYDKRAREAFVDALELDKKAIAKAAAAAVAKPVQKSAKKQAVAHG